MILCYDCKNFHTSNLSGDASDLKCVIYNTYVLTPEKAGHCKHYVNKRGVLSNET